MVAAITCCKAQGDVMSAERINCTLLAAEFSVAWLIGASIMALTAWAILVVRCVRRAF